MFCCLIITLYKKHCVLLFIMQNNERNYEKAESEETKKRKKTKQNKKKNKKEYVSGHSFMTSAKKV